MTKTIMTSLLLTFSLVGAETNQPIVEGLLKQNEQLTKIIEENNKIIYASEETAKISTSTVEQKVETSRHKYSVSLNYTYLDGYRNLRQTYDLGKVESTDHPAISIAWSPLANAWLEGSIGSKMIENFPSKGLGTRILAYSIRAKYKYDILNSGILISPYLGYQVIDADSPGAGEVDPNLNLPQSYYANELYLVEDLNQSRFVFGGGLSKIFFQNWQARLEIGSDWQALGLAYRL